MISERRAFPHRATVLGAALVLGVAFAHGLPSAGEDDAYVAEIESYRAAREARLRAPDGWLSLIGLFWLEEGDNRFGSDPDLPIVLPADAAPSLAGNFRYEDGAVRLIPAPGVTITVGGKPVTDQVLADDGEGHPDVVGLGRLSLYVIRRGDRRGIRAKDPQAPTRTEFHGLEFFPIDPRFRVEATFEPYDHPRKVLVPTVVGVPAEMTVPGKLLLPLGDTTYTIEPLLENPGDEELFIIFKDETSGTETYGAGRFLYVPFEGPRTVVDFNKAYNPPCAFTPFATCPLPPRSNRLPIPIRAGEKRYGDH